MAIYFNCKFVNSVLAETLLNKPKNPGSEYFKCLYITLHCSFFKPMIRGDLWARAVRPTKTDHTNPLILGPVNVAPHILSLYSFSPGRNLAPKLSSACNSSTHPTSPFSVRCLRMSDDPDPAICGSAVLYSAPVPLSTPF